MFVEGDDGVSLLRVGQDFVMALDERGVLASVQVAATFRAPAEARERVCFLARGWLPGEALHTVRLLVSELVTNTVRHGDCAPTEAIDVHVRREGESVRIEICQEASVQGVKVVQRHAGQEGGWGLALVETLAEEWGVQPEPPCVWFKLAAAA